MKSKSLFFVVSGVVLFLLGIWVGESLEPQSVQAQQERVTDLMRYELIPGAYGTQSWYALKLDRQTGEVWVLDAKQGAQDEVWMVLPVNRKDGN